MTLPWFLNPWAEVRRLRDKVRLTEGAEELAWATADAAIAERNAATGTAAIDVHFEKFDVRKAFPTHPDFGEVIRMVPAEELERSHTENADLRRRIAEMDSSESGAENCRFHQNTWDLIQSLEKVAKRQMTAEEIEIQRQNYALSFGRGES